MSFYVTDVFRGLSSDLPLTNVHKTSPGENWNRPVFRFITKDLTEVLTEAQTETVLIRAVAKHRRTHSLWEEEDPVRHEYE